MRFVYKEETADTDRSQLLTFVGATIELELELELATYLITMTATMKITSLLVIAIAVTTVMADTRLSYWDGANFSGPSNTWTLNGNGQCEDFEGFDRRISSVNTNGGCAIIFTEKGCQGESRRLSPGAGNQCSHNNLASCNFDNRARSMKAC